MIGKQNYVHPLPSHEKKLRHSPGPD